MQRSRPTKGGEHEVAWIVAALDGYDLEDFCHRVIDYVDDGSRGRLDIDSERLGEPRTDRGRGGRMIDGEVSVEQGALVEVAEQ